MTALLTLAGAAAVADWAAVARRHERAELVFKPLTLAFLVGAAVVLEPTSEARRAWFVAALVLSLAGDVFLMLPRDLFVHGLASFLVAHLAYIAGFLTAPPEPGPLVASALVVVAVLVVVGTRVARGAPERLRPPVLAYMIVLSAMVALALASGRALAAAAGILFYTSDALIGWRRFVEERGWMPVTIIVTYHLAQAGFVLSLAR